MRFKLAFLALALSVFLGCDSKSGDIPISVYSQDEYWFDNGKALDPKLVDVFYVLPTCIWDWTDENGTVHHHADILNAKQRAAMKPSYESASAIFADSCNFFAPYYRQISLNSWMEGYDTVNARFPVSMGDIREAFAYYLKNRNNGRPFVLAGFSQGGKAVVELLKTMPGELYERMVAAYVIGYRVTTEDLNSTVNLKQATGADDIGVTICYNSTNSPAGSSPLMVGNKLCINPINWTTDATVAQLNDTVTLHTDKENAILILKGLNADAYYHKSLEKLFPKGNFHLEELNFYKDNLRGNVKQRIRKFTSAVER